MSKNSFQSFRKPSKTEKAMAYGPYNHCPDCNKKLDLFEKARGKCSLCNRKFPVRVMPGRYIKW